MNENLNLEKILKYRQKGIKLYSPALGEVEFEGINYYDRTYPIMVKTKDGTFCFTKQGKLYDIKQSECLLFPSREQRDWSKFTAPWYKNERDTIDWLEKQGEYLENYDDAEKEKADFVGDGFIECHADFLDFKEGNTYWLEYIGDDKYNVRSDNLLCKTYHITPCQLYTVFKKLTWLEKQGKQETLCDKCRKDHPSQSCPDITELGRCAVEHKPADKVEPKFKVGNWYQCTKNFVGKGVIFDRNTAYYCAQEGCLQDEYGCHIAIVKDLYDNFKLWTIQDAKDGDVLANDHHILILKELVYDWSSNGTPYSVKAYCGIKPNGNFEIGKDSWCFCGTLHIHPATKEQHDALMKAMNDAGYKWNTETKTLGKLIESKFDPKTLKPFDKVLGFFNGVWNCDLYSHYYNDDRMFPYVCFRSCVSRIVPYNEETKHLVGTSEEAPEFYRYWED